MSLWAFGCRRLRGSDPGSVAVMGSELVEADDRWLVPMVGTVTQCRVDYAFTVVVMDEDAGYFEARIEQPFVLARGAKEASFDPEGDPVALAPVLRVLRGQVEQAVAFKDGRLELVLGDGVMLRVAAGGRYEAWQIAGPRGLLIVSMPGGELAVWDSAAE